MAVVFITTIDQSLRLMKDFFSLLFLSAQLITESHQTWYKQQHPETEAGSPKLTEITINERTLDDMRREHGQFFLQTILVRGFEAYQAYLTDLLEANYDAARAKLAIADPHADVLVRRLMDDHLRGFARGGRRDQLIKELRERFGLPLLLTADERQKERRIAEIRNLIVHNRAVVTAR